MSLSETGQMHLRFVGRASDAMRSLALVRLCSVQSEGRYEFEILEKLSEEGTNGAVCCAPRASAGRIPLFPRQRPEGSRRACSPRGGVHGILRCLKIRVRNSAALARAVA